MKIKKHLLLFLLVIIVGIVCVACGDKETDKTTSTTESKQEKEESREPLEEETKTLSLNNTYTTKFSEVNAITYPDFSWNYPDNWTISQEEVTQISETVTLINERGITIKFSHIGGVAEGQLGGGSGSYMKRVKISKIADSNFVPGYVQATDYSNLGTFIVAELATTGELNMQTDSDFTEVTDNVSYAVVPETMLGTRDDITRVFEGEFAFWYSDYISFIASSPDNKFSETEKQEVVEILSSFRNADNGDNAGNTEPANKSNTTGKETTLKEMIDTNNPVVFYFLDFSYASDYTILDEDSSIETASSKIFVFDNGKVSSIDLFDEFNNETNMKLGDLLSIPNNKIMEKASDWKKYILTGETDTSGTALTQEEFWYENGSGYSGHDLYMPVSIEINGNYYAGLYKSGGSWIQLFVTPCEQGTTFSFDDVKDVLTNPTNDNIKNAFK